MHEKLKDSCPILVNLKGPILLHDNARPHVSQITVQKVNELTPKATKGLAFDISKHRTTKPVPSPRTLHLGRATSRQVINPSAATSNSDSVKTTTRQAVEGDLLRTPMKIVRRGSGDLAGRNRYRHPEWSVFSRNPHALLDNRAAGGRKKKEEEEEEGTKRTGNDDNYEDDRE
ncbi:Histone-lysine N-methyltransferase SETMAR [Habropoda laboriosa]|uniref:Histone-lysine N-methyltransferase SETMAR n=1 Tax=Habropoda laboriosa TaxID=597456 RepID=A0A0L7R874_9HYME|nr:Histone-lysine N-methyltransferase SETMAR [Habropoda laboriosa]